jgi:general secretion pathway protein K
MIGRLKNESGFALILTLVITALMVAIVVEMTHQVYVDLSLSRGFRDGQQASILAESGVDGGIKLIQWELKEGRDYTSLSDLWAIPRKLEDEVGSLTISISDENAKININNIITPNSEYDTKRLGMVQRLGTRFKLRNESWGAVADWIDSNDIPRSGGAESSYYRALKPPYIPRNSALPTVSELTLVMGFTPEMVASLRPFVTVYSAKSIANPINVNTAPLEVLAALDSGIDDRLAARIIEERKIKPFKKGELSSRVPGMETIGISLGGYVDVNSSLFRISSVARVKDSVRTVEAVVRLSGEVLAWQEY